MPGFKKIFGLAALALLCSHLCAARGAAETARPALDRLFDGARVVNVVDDFLAFWDQAKDKPLARQRIMWARMVENKHRDYFDRAVYRNADPKMRLALVDEFLVRIPERVDALREFNKNITDIRTSPLALAFIDFKMRFREYQQLRDIYVGLSLFRFDGAVRPAQNDSGIPDTLCLGSEVMCRYTPDQIRVALAHEFFHLYHFSFLFQRPTLAEFRLAHMPLMIEGMAVAATEAVYPNRPRSYYLHFTNDELVSQENSMASSAGRFLELITTSAPPEQYERWFTNAPSDEALPRGGYLLGYEVTSRALETFTLEQMVRMSPADLREQAEEHLAAIAGNHILVMASDY